jgi:dephospho-CoA kinase
MKIAFVGHAAVGKDTLSDYTALKLGLVNISSGNLIRDYVRLHNLGSMDRENLINVGNNLRHEHGGDYLVRLAFEKQKDNVIISGLRTIDEVTTFKNNGGIIIAVTAGDQKRYKLAQIRKRIGDEMAFAEWHAVEMKEYSSTDNKMQNLEGVIALADFQIENTGSLGELYQKCDRVLAQIV